MRFLSALLAAMLMTACSMTVPVRGQTQGTDETFSGTATGHMDGSGELTIVSSRGSTCKGNFVNVTRRQGEGVFVCDDRRSGPFSFVSSGRRGTGYGTLSGERFTFTFGD